MAEPASRADLIEYTLRQLGKPVVEINVADEQIQDRLDDALQIFRTYHFDGVEKMYLSHTLTQQDLDNDYITLPPAVMSVVRIFPYSVSLSTNNIFSIRYQMAMNDLFDFSSIDLSYYEIAKQHINLLEEMLVGEPSIRFNKHMDKVFIDTSWERHYTVGDKLLFEVYASLDGDEYPSIWNDEFLKKYFTALVKRQWGSNLKKFSGVTMMGGITLNGQEIYDEGKQEVEQCELELVDKYSYPPQFFMR